MSEVTNHEQEVVAQEIRGTENGATQSNVDSNWKGRGRTSGSSYGNFSGRATGEDRTRATVFEQLIVTGGIITRLIGQAEQRIKEHDDRIIWYQEQKQKELEELEELKALQRLVLQTQGDEVKESPEEE